MFEKLDLTRMAQSLAAHSGARMAVIAQNVANADTPGYRSRDVISFDAFYAQKSGEMRATREGHLRAEAGFKRPDIFLSGGDAAPNQNDVSLEFEMVKTAVARQDHEMALAVYRATSGVIRASLGRNG